MVTASNAKASCQPESDLSVGTLQALRALRFVGGSTQQAADLILKQRQKDKV